MATSAASLVPTIDIAHPTADALADVDAACRDHGFFLLKGHGLDELIDRMWDRSWAFFNAPRSNKTAISRDADNPLGYWDRELTKRRRDHKEVFDFMDPRVPAEHNRNRWPAEPDNFRSTLEEFYDAFADLAERTTALVHRAAGLEEELASRHGGNRTSSAVRLNHYPVGDPVPEEERDGLIDLGETALGYHTDPGVLTLLLQDDTGGLQAQSQAPETHGQWIDIEPQPGTIVVNLADVMQVWTNDQYKAAVHRVIPMTKQGRLSIPFFLNPSRDIDVEPIASLSEDAPVYRRFAWREFMQARNDDNFSDLGTEDTQIANYRIA